MFEGMQNTFFIFHITGRNLQLVRLKVLTVTGILLIKCNYDNHVFIKKKKSAPLLELVVQHFDFLRASS